MKIVFILAMLCFSGSSTWCQKTHDSQRDLPLRKRYKPVGYANTLTANFPALFSIDYLPGTSAGLEYERFMNQRGRFSISVPAYVFIAKSLYKSGYGPELKGYYAAPALMFHPLGNTNFVDYSFGPAIAIGNLELTEYDIRDQITRYDRQNFLAVLIKGNLTIHTTGHFIFAVHVSAGSMLGNTLVESLLVQFGIRIGVRF
jgi:hypothetical protein